jgi:hypothetical protein
MPGYETPVGKMAKGAGRGLLGFLKMIPIVGNIINGIDFIKDIPRAMQSFGNPNLTFMQKLKSGADLLFHGAGMLVPQVGASYDMAQGALRVAGGAIQSMEYGPMAQLPTWQFNNAGFNPMYNMQYQNPMMSNPYAYGQFPNYSQYPSYPAGQAFQPPWLQGNYNMPYPVVPYGTPPMQYPMANYDPFMGSPYGYGYNPYMANPAMTSPMFGTPQDGLAGMGRAALGATKMVPVLGNLINGFDFLRDIGHLGRAMRGDPSQSFMKSASDLLFHGVGMLIPQVGASYDIAQGTMRAGAAAMNPMNFMNRLPPFAFNPGGYNPMYPGTMF